MLTSYCSKGTRTKKGLFIFIFSLTEFTLKIDLQYLCRSFFKMENAYKIVLFPPSSRKSASPGKTYSARGSFLLFFFYHHYCEYYYRMQRTKNTVNRTVDKQFTPFSECSHTHTLSLTSVKLHMKIPVLLLYGHNFP